VSLTDYVIDILLIAVIFRQVRPHPLTLRAALLPLVLLAIAGAIYLKPPFTARGNDLALIVILTVVGAVLGLISGLADRVWANRAGALLYRVSVLSVVAWIAGMGLRFAFQFWAYHSGGPSIARFSVSHHITGASTWTTAFFLMAFGQVIARVGVLQLRRIRSASAMPGHETAAIAR
jgi:hypothetical protein